MNAKRAFVLHQQIRTGTHFSSVVATWTSLMPRSHRDKTAEFRRVGRCELRRTDSREKLNLRDVI